MYWIGLLWNGVNLVLKIMFVLSRLVLVIMFLCR